MPMFPDYDDSEVTLISPPPRKRLCADRLCGWPDHPNRQGFGCSSEEMNTGAFDADDFIHIRQWDDCPYYAWLEREEAGADADQNSQDRQADTYTETSK